MTDPISRTAREGTARGSDLRRIGVPKTSVQRVEADGVHVFYRAAGDPNSPVILLLHGFPASSFMFRELIPRLALNYQVIAPDLPGFGFTEVLPERKYLYSFNQLALTIEAFTRALKLDRYAIYVFDYGAPAFGRQRQDSRRELVSVGHQSRVRQATSVACQPPNRSIVKQQNHLGRGFVRLSQFSLAWPDGCIPKSSLLGESRPPQEKRT